MPCRIIPYQFFDSTGICSVEPWGDCYRGEDFLTGLFVAEADDLGRYGIGRLDRFYFKSHTLFGKHGFLWGFGTRDCASPPTAR